jgi:hypothetical protein
VNKEIAKIMLKTGAKFIAMIAVIGAWIIGGSILLENYFGLSHAATLAVTAGSFIAVIAVKTLYDYAKWQAEYNAKFSNK